MRCTTTAPQLAIRRQNRYHPTFVGLFIPLLSSAALPPVLSISSPHFSRSWLLNEQRTVVRPTFFLSLSHSPPLFVTPRSPATLQRCFCCPAGMADIMTEVVPRSTGCDPAGVRILGCEKADNVCISVQAAGDLLAVKTDALVAGVVAVVSEEDDYLRGSDGSDSSMTNGLPSKVVELSTEVKKFDREGADGVMAEMIEREEFKGKAGTWCAGRLPSSNKNIRNVALLGCGNPKELNSSSCAKLGSDLAALLKSVKAKSVTLVLPEDFSARQIQAVLEGLLVHSSPDNRFKSLKSTCVKPPPFDKVDLLVAPTAKDAVEKAVSSAAKVARGVYFAQQLVAAPANYINTITLAQEAVRMARQHGLSAKVLDQADIEKLNMGAYLGARSLYMFPAVVTLIMIPVNYSGCEGVDVPSEVHSPNVQAG
eukprot:GHVS01050167.1.p1 GENE.GHVS01050167.1~~GHVS01050167.1.p1  ORF type:complete len:424 (-),score=61.30 GHVS01050167.1:1003-2274(-)